GPQAARHPPAAPATLSAGLGERGRGPLHRQGADAHRRCAEHEPLPHVLLVQEGAGRTRLHRAPVAECDRRRRHLVPQRGLHQVTTALTLAALIPVAVWLYLLIGRGMFWVMAERDDADNPPEPTQWPSVVAVVPARNEADVIAHSIGSLLDQDYPGDFRIVLV